MTPFKTDVGDRLIKYTAIKTASFHSDFDKSESANIDLAHSVMVRLSRSEFCSGVYGTVYCN